MKLTLIFVLVAVTQISAKTNGQNISINCKKMPLEKVFPIIEKQSNYNFVYSKEQLENAKSVTLKFKDAPLNNVLNSIFESQRLSYTIIGDYIVIKQQHIGSVNMQDESIILPPPVTIKGTVRDEKGNPLPKASIVVKGTKIGTTTNENGEFNLEVPSNTNTIIISYVGYKNVEINIKGKIYFEVVLKSEITQQEDVVVVGAQRQTRRFTTAAISSVTGKQIGNTPVSSVDQLLQGRIAGVNVQITSGEPGVTPTVVVRGNSTVNTKIGDNATVSEAQALSSPLYVVDGMPLSATDISNSVASTGTNFLAGININDIESVDVQKDAVAKAAWGSRGANGVIYIKTKRGKSGLPQFEVNVYTGLIQSPELLKTYTGAQEREQKMNILKQYGTYTQIASQIPQILTDDMNPSYNNATDWQNLFYRSARLSNVDGSFSGSANNVTYRFGMNYYNEEGIIKSFGFTRYSFRGNFDFKISPKLNTQILLGASRSERKRGMKYNNSDDNTPVSGASIPTSFYKLNAIDSALYLGTESNLRNKNFEDNYQASMMLNYDVLPSLRYTLQASATVINDNRDYFKPSTRASDASSRFANQPNYAESDRDNFTTYFVSNTLNFNKSFKFLHQDNNVVLTASQQFSRDVVTSTDAGGSYTPNNNVQTVNNIPQAYISAYSDYQASAILSYLGQFEYDINKKYILYGSLRTDASSRFGKNSKWGTFPAAGAGWIVSDEKFFQKLSNVINFLKLRVSIGKSGNNSSYYYAPYNSYAFGGYYNGDATMHPNYSNGLTKNNLTWSTNIDKNIGMDAYFFKSKLLVSIDVFDRKTKGDFYDFTLPFFTGYNSINFNANDLWVSNKGVDLSININNIKIAKNFTYGTNFVLSYVKNRIAKLPDNNRTFIISDYNGGVARIYSVGQPIYEMFQMKYLGVYNHESDIPINPLTGQKITYYKGYHTVVAGDPIWKDVNNDYDVFMAEDNGDQYGDRLPSGDPNPKFTGGWTNEVYYKNFSLSVLSVFTFKRAIYNTYFQSQIGNITGGYSSSLNNFAVTRTPNMDGINYWTPKKAAASANYKADFPSINPFNGSDCYQYIPISDQFTEDGSYFKISTITLGYMLPQSAYKNLKLKSARAYLMIDNIATFKKASMPNPELVDEVGSYTGGLYPTPTKYTLGIDIIF